MEEECNLCYTLNKQHHHVAIGNSTFTFLLHRIRLKQAGLSFFSYLIQKPITHMYRLQYHTFHQRNKFREIPSWSGSESGEASCTQCSIALESQKSPTHEVCFWQKNRAAGLEHNNVCTYKLHTCRGTAWSPIRSIQSLGKFFFITGSATTTAWYSHPYLLNLAAHVLHLDFKVQKF